jgi:hypothetical protein
VPYGVHVFCLSGDSLLHDAYVYSSSFCFVWRPMRVSRSPWGGIAQFD